MNLHLKYLVLLLLAILISPSLIAQQQNVVSTQQQKDCKDCDEVKKAMKEAGLWKEHSKKSRRRQFKKWKRQFSGRIHARIQKVFYCSNTSKGRLALCYRWN